MYVKDFAQTIRLYTLQICFTCHLICQRLSQQLHMAGSISILWWGVQCCGVRTSNSQPQLSARRWSPWGSAQAYLSASYNVPSFKDSNPGVAKKRKPETKLVLKLGNVPASLLGDQGRRIWPRPADESPGNLSQLHVGQRMAMTFPHPLLWLLSALQRRSAHKWIEPWYLVKDKPGARPVRPRSLPGWWQRRERSRSHGSRERTEEATQF